MLVETCELCDTPLVVVDGNGKRRVFKAHNDEFCKRTVQVHLKLLKKIIESQAEQLTALTRRPPLVNLLTDALTAQSVLIAEVGTLRAALKERDRLVESLNQKLQVLITKVRDVGQG